MAKSRGVHLYVGTRKGAYVVSSDAKRRKWKVRGPYHEGKDVFHVAPDPRTPGTVYAAANSPWWGPTMHRSRDNGLHWKEIAPPMMTVFKQRPPPDPETGPAKHPITNLWHVEPGHSSEPKRIWLGIDPANLFVSDDEGNSWTEMDGLNKHPTRPKWNPGAGGMCLHTILQDPTRPRRMYAGISAAGTFRSDDGGESWRPVNSGVEVSFQPEKFPEVGQCVHKVALDPANPETLYRQDHDGVYVSRDGMESWDWVGKPLGDDFGFVVTAPPAMPGGAFFVPLHGMSRTTPRNELQIWRYTDAGHRWAKTIPGGTFIGDYGMHREGLGSDDQDPAGVYLGTTNGALVYTNDGGHRWGQIPYSFPSIHSVTAASA